MAINQLTTANTFQHWLQATQSLISVANTLTDGNGATFIANTILEVSGAGSQLNVRNSGAINTFYANTANIANVSFSGSNISVPGNVEISGNLVVSGNITLDSVGFDDLIVSGGATIGTTLDVTGNTTLTNATITYGNFTTANVITLVGSANTAIYANISAARVDALSAGSYANSAFIHANSAYSSQNTTGSYANSAFTAANTAASDGLAFAIALG